MTNEIAQAVSDTTSLWGTGGIAGGGVLASILAARAWIGKALQKIEDAPSKADLETVKTHNEQSHKEIWLEINGIKEKAARHEAVVEAVKESVEYIRHRVDEINNKLNSTRS